MEDGAVLAGQAAIVERAVRNGAGAGAGADIGGDNR